MSKSPPRPVGFLVWNPEGRLPSAVHDTFERANAERDRLQSMYPDARFYVMAPVASEKAEKRAEAFSRGRKEGYEEAKREVIHAEARCDQLTEQNAALRKREAPVEHILASLSDLQATAADCLCWFDGFSAAHAGKDSYDRPAIPERDKLQRLNGALQRAVRASDASLDIDDDEIPF